MNKLTKVVNIYPSMPIIGVNPPIRSVVKRVTKSVDEIRTCLMARAIVEEVLPGGKTVRLNIGNYDKVATEECKCEPKCSCCKCKVTIEHNVEEEKTPWQKVYDSVIDGRNLAEMTRKQRRSIEASARAAADAAVAESKPEVTVEETKVDITEAEVVEETEEVETIDVETIK